MCLTVIVPAFRGEESPFYGRFASVGGSPDGDRRDGLHRSGRDRRRRSRPATTSRTSSCWRWPLAGVFLLAPGLAAVALPQLARQRAVGLVDDDRSAPPLHRRCDPVPRRRHGARARPLRRRPAGGCRGRGAPRLVALPRSSSGPGRARRAHGPVGFHATLPPSHVAALQSAVALVPDGAPVSDDERGGLAPLRPPVRLQRPRRRPRRVDRPRHLGHLDAAGGVAEEGLHPELLARVPRPDRASPGWRQVFEQDGVFVFERVRRG